MSQKLIRSTLCFIVAGILSIASGAVNDTIKGWVSDSATGDPIDSLKVASEGASTLTNSIGAFNLAIPVTRVARFESPRYMPTLSWRPESGTFTWSGYSGDLSIKVYTMQGNVVAGQVSGKNSTGSRFSIANLPQGIYMVAIEAQGRTAVYEIHYVKINQVNSFSILTSSSAIGPLLKALATSKPHTLSFIKKGDTLGKMTVPAGTAARLAIKLKPASASGKLVKVFDGKTLDGWNSSCSGCWSIKAADSAMTNTDARSHVYTTKQYLHYRASYWIKHGGGGHRSCSLFLGQNHNADADGAIQFQIPECTGGWDYRPGKNSDLSVQRFGSPPCSDNCGNNWVEVEVVVKTEEGWVDGGMAYPPGSKGKKLMRFSDNSVKTYKASSLAFQSHGGNANDLYKNIYIEENPTDDSLLITKRP